MRKLPFMPLPSVVIVTLGVYWLALIYQLSAQWTVYEQYNYGWAVPFLCAYLAWQRVQTGKLEKVRTQSVWTGFALPNSVCYLLIALCALLYAPTRFLHEANPIWRFTSLLWALEVIVITLVLLRFVCQASDSQLRISQFAFPVCFFLVAVPWPSGLESWLVQLLTRLNVSATTELLGWFGIPALQHGNVIEVATGNVGIDEACSGIRSFQATLMIALFFGELYRISFSRRLTCVFAGFALSFVFNIVRTTLLTLVAAKHGVAAVATWHDPAGVTILVACFLTLWLTAKWLKKGNGRQFISHNTGAGKRAGEIIEVATSTTVSTLSTHSIQPSIIRRLAIALLVWFVLVEAGTQCWYLHHENSVMAHEQWSLDLDGVGPSVTKVAIPADILVQFKADEEIEAKWHDNSGYFWQLYYFRWYPTRSLKRRVIVQLAKTHGPEKCLPAVGMTMKAQLGVVTIPVGNMKFALKEYLFLDGNQPLYVFYAIYEDQTGSMILANRRQDAMSRIVASLKGSRNDDQRFFEIAVMGPQDAASAESALSRQLDRIITSRGTIPSK
jgi:exosortase